ncbi:MAG: hypothetical protein ABFD50_15470 [Smithella sp.]
MNGISFEKLIRTKQPKPRELPICGMGQLHSEQQFCFEEGWKAGIKAFRKAQREHLAKYKVASAP